MAELKPYVDEVRSGLRRCVVRGGAFCLTLVLGLGGAWSAMDAAAQGAVGSPRIVVPKHISAKEQSESPFAISVEHAEAVPPDSWIEIFCPSAVTFSSGRDPKGVWRVSLAELAKLRMKIPSGAAGKSNIFVMLINHEATVALAVAELTILPQSAPETATPKVAEPPRDVQVANRAHGDDAGGRRPGDGGGAVNGASATAEISPPPAESTEAAPEDKVAATSATPAPDSSVRPQIERYLATGAQYLAQGNISIARQYFLRAVELGSAKGAFKLAETFDPLELAKSQVIGVRPDPDEALRWYQRAVQLGDVAALSRAQRLGDKK